MAVRRACVAQLPLLTRQPLTRTQQNLHKSTVEWYWQLKQGSADFSLSFCERGGVEGEGVNEGRVGVGGGRDIFGSSAFPLPFILFSLSPVLPSLRLPIPLFSGV